MDIYVFLENWIWFGFAAIGFAILFNVPRRTLLPIFFMSALGGLVKLFFLSLNVGVITATLVASFLIGFLSIYAAHSKHSPPFVFAIPSVIPMVPGSFAYFTMRGIIRLSYNSNPDNFVALLNDTITNGFMTLFVLMAITLGVSAPMLLTRRESAKQIKVHLLKKEDKNAES
ncbi:threonine/serine exporter family protein [Flavobacteriaceae bacterium SZ-1-7]|uniref:threonine/serine exporter family protein n=1 Tax=Tamlana sedimenti TaxID=3134126 RepID=UPI0031213919